MVDAETEIESANSIKTECERENSYHKEDAELVKSTAWSQRVGSNEKLLLDGKSAVGPIYRGNIQISVGYPPQNSSARQYGEKLLSVNTSQPFNIDPKTRLLLPLHNQLATVMCIPPKKYLFDDEFLFHQAQQQDHKLDAEDFVNVTDTTDGDLNKITLKRLICGDDYHCVDCIDDAAEGLKDIVAGDDSWDEDEFLLKSASRDNFSHPEAYDTLSSYGTQSMELDTIVDTSLHLVYDDSCDMSTFSTMDSDASMSETLHSNSYETMDESIFREQAVEYPESKFARIVKREKDAEAEEIADNIWSVLQSIEQTESEFNFIESYKSEEIMPYVPWRRGNYIRRNPTILWSSRIHYTPRWPRKILAGNNRPIIFCRGTNKRNMIDQFKEFMLEQMTWIESDTGSIPNRDATHIGTERKQASEEGHLTRDVAKSPSSDLSGTAFEAKEIMLNDSEINSGFEARESPYDNLPNLAAYPVETSAQFSVSSFYTADLHSRSESSVATDVHMSMVNNVEHSSSDLTGKKTEGTVQVSDSLDDTFRPASKSNYDHKSTQRIIFSTADSMERCNSTTLCSVTSRDQAMSATNDEAKVNNSDGSKNGSPSIELANGSGNDLQDATSVDLPDIQGITFDHESMKCSDLKTSKDTICTSITSTNDAPPITLEIADDVSCSRICGDHEQSLTTTKTPSEDQPSSTPYIDTTVDDKKKIILRKRVLKSFLRKLRIPLSPTMLKVENQ